jgi:hypothetical protein
MRFYKTNYSNEVHQLLITPSRHLHVLRDGRLKYQRKPIESRPHRIEDSPKARVIHFIVRDRYSKAMYAEIHLWSEKMSPQSFLWKAWSKKSEFPFCGMPEVLILPSPFDHMAYALRTMGITTIRPTGGFMAGVRTFRDWEQYLSFVYDYPFEPLHSFEDLQAKTNEINQIYYDRSSDGRSKLRVWESGLRQLRLPPERNEFLNVFLVSSN